MNRIVLVGPTNVGKSTLFNKLTRSRAAIVCDRPGVTVDRHERVVHETPLGSVEIVDTGGVGPSLEEHPLGKEIEHAASQAVETASVILFVVDGTRDMGIEEFEVARWLRRSRSIDDKPVFVVCNKSDTKKFNTAGAWSLGFEKVIEVSAEHGDGIDGLWDILKSYLVPEEAPPVDTESARVVVLGRPNVGKSTLLNRILGEDRHVVSPVAGTTRDVVESTYERRGKKFRLLDTAGMRRPGRLERDVEWVAREKLKDAAREADCAILVVDASEGVTDLDAAIGGMAIEFGLSLVIVFNKWDLMSGDKADDRLMKMERTRDLKLEFLTWTPQIQISALSGKGLPLVEKAIDRVLEARKFRAQTSKLNKLFETQLRLHHHPSGPGGKAARFYYLSQVETNPPEFVLFSNLPANAVHFSYRRYLSNSLRKEFGFEGTPLKLHFKTTKGSPRP